LLPAITRLARRSVRAPSRRQPQRLSLAPGARA
jgi:hypothetical protein